MTRLAMDPLLEIAILASAPLLEAIIVISTMNETKLALLTILGCPSGDSRLRLVDQ